MKIHKNIYLKGYTTLSLGGKVAYLIEVFDDKEIITATLFARKNGYKIYAIGSGSNIVASDHISKTVVIKPVMKGIKILKEDEKHVLIEVKAGEMWDNFVGHCVDLGWAGLESLSLIPGTCGAAPVQNIGAYGSEIKSRIKKVCFFDLKDKKFYEFNNEQCLFSYRDSIFKKQKGRFIIESVIFCLSKGEPNLPKYSGLADELKKVQKNQPELSLLKAIRQSVINIRKRKLPDPKDLPNAGSFFKNIYLSNEESIELFSKFSDVPMFKENDKIKIPTAWLIEKAGWKGYFKDGVGVYDKNALIIYNKSNSSEKLLGLASDIQKSVKNLFNLEINIEPDILK